MKLDFLQENNLVFFSFEKIKTFRNELTGEEKKVLVGMPSGWQTLTQETSFINGEEHSAYGIVTGVKSGITVVDFDNINTYNMLIQTFPELNKCMKVKTRKGYHLYFKYNPDLINSTDIGNLPGIDIRNDGGFIIGPGTKYKTSDGERHKYKLVEGDIMEIPQTLLSQFKEKAFKPKPKKEESKKESKQERSSASQEEITKLLNILDSDYYEDYEKWRNVGFIINNELEDDGYIVFKDFSKQSNKFNEKECYSFYSNIKKKDSGLKIGSLHKWAKECDEEEYNKLFPKKEQKKQSNYEELKVEFEKKNFKLRSPVCFAELSKYDGLVMRSKKDLNDVYQNLMFEEIIIDKHGHQHKQMKQFTDEWLKDEKARTYEKVDFKPCQETPEDIYNLFNGFEVCKKELKDVDVKTTKVYEHLFNICGREEASLEYVLNCLANIVQQPYKLTKTSLIFRSVQGCGKDTFFNWFGEKILGKQYYMNDSKTELIFGRFNSMISKKLLVVINEVNQHDTHKIIDNIKDAITKETNKIEIKGKEPRDEQNNIFYVYLTNSENPLPIEQTDRRFVAMECNKEVARNQDYFNALYDELDSGKVDKAFYEFLLKRNLKGYDFDKNRPKTQLYKTMKERNTPVLALFLCEVVDSKIKSYSGVGFYEHLSAWLINNGYKDYKYTNTKFGIDIKSYPGITKGKDTKGCVEYKLDKKILKDFLIKNEYYEILPEFID